MRISTNREPRERSKRPDRLILSGLFYEGKGKGEMGKGGEFILDVVTLGRINAMFDKDVALVFIP